MLGSLLARKGSCDALLLGSFVWAVGMRFMRSSIAPMEHWIRNVKPLALTDSGEPAAIKDIPAAVVALPPDRLDPHNKTAGCQNSQS